ncbi:23S rRNA (adenine(2030)-N(6))-methyltransferase RlmJ [Bowmanella yangjiangensis]|uniref:Ribosomal RNA large subunit methyltransferase J n=1 Tax=Bowmanella yangjiangensis TaxID=2811230 RepID=A0ABS3CVH5_9ALTE|nr:23S rRNA (adenine(2030)-N(6))-methyltransferase RlmJ [Bowmanella yangjiangensis]MBN7821119.1 23S rRNA (adenine(2030)-N(6))-methyltransferase RlmJ [Bowmanella yangjiangensis]
MFSYRHGYHAGNHADVLKHLCQMLLLNKLAEKDKAFVYIDTHSGAGLYDLTSAQAQKTGEYKDGIDRLLDANCQDSNLRSYIKLVDEYRRDNRYPGSPELARRLCRSQDSLQLMEWHNNEVQNLRANFKGVRNAHTHHRNGFEGLVAMSPPKPARGLVLIDPSYELEADYQELVSAVKESYKRWKTGIFAIWYPLLAKSRDRSEKMTKALAAIQGADVLDIQLKLHPQEQDVGMYGSGMLVINPPWQFDTQLEALMPELLNALKDWPGASYQLNWLTRSE